MTHSHCVRKLFPAKVVGSNPIRSTPLGVPFNLHGHVIDHFKKDVTLVKWGQRYRKTMKARFNGKCVECGEAIKTGKEILKNSKDQWVHKSCSDVEEELP